MKFNWGTGIALFYTIFAAVLIFAVIKSTSYDNSLVSDQYYADDLKYQEHYVKLVNSKALTEDLKIVRGKTDVTLTFPAEVGVVQGEIVFFCPSDSKQDFTLPVRPDAERRQNVPIEGLKPGLWKVKVDWQANGKTHYKEETVVF